MTDLTDKKEPTYYVSLTDYNEVKRMFLKADNDINKLKELLKDAREKLHSCCPVLYSNLINQIDEVLK